MNIDDISSPDFNQYPTKPTKPQIKNTNTSNISSHIPYRIMKQSKKLLPGVISEVLSLFKSIKFLLESLWVRFPEIPFTLYLSHPLQCLFIGDAFQIPRQNFLNLVYLALLSANVVSTRSWVPYCVGNKLFFSVSYLFIYFSLL